MKLERVDAATVTRLLAGELDGRTPAPGWPHQDTAPGLSFVIAGGASFLVIDDDGRIAGECGTKTPPGPDGAVEIGYGLAAPSRGRGLGSVAVAALVAEVSSWPEVRRIEAEVQVSNLASRRIVERLGFDLIVDPIAGYVRYALEVPAG